AEPPPRVPGHRHPPAPPGRRARVGVRGASQGGVAAPQHLAGTPDTGDLAVPQALQRRDRGPRVPLLRHHPAPPPAGAHTVLRARRRLHLRCGRLPRPARDGPCPPHRRPGGHARLSPRAGAHVARQPRRPRRAGSPLRRRSWRHRPGRRLGRRRYRTRARALDARQRSHARHPPRPARALGRPDDQHPADQGARRHRPLAVLLEAPGLCHLVGRVHRRPRPSRGLTGARGPARPAPGAPALRHARPPVTGLPAAGPAGRRLRLGPEEHRGAGPHPRLRDPALHPGGEPGDAPDRGIRLV
ncbi:MAG: Putative esterase, partial [uncultured Nocardioides sp.]